MKSYMGIIHSWKIVQIDNTFHVIGIIGKDNYIRTSPVVILTFDGEMKGGQVETQNSIYALGRPLVGSS